jgi:hypothetical protein
MRHNKKRNTAFLYECLIKELTKSIVRKDTHKKDKVLSIMKEYFYKGSLLSEDLQLYKQLLETKISKEPNARRFLFEVRKDWETLHRKDIFNFQTALIKQINESLDANVFSCFVENYREIASVGSFLQSSGYKAKQRILAEDRVVSLLSRESVEQTSMKHIDNLTYNTFVEKFNESYKHTLRDEQRMLLTNYITSFSDNGLGLKTYMNEELGRLKEKINTLLVNSTFSADYKAKFGKILEKLDSFSSMKIDESMVKDTFYIQDLIAEVQKNANN